VTKVTGRLPGLSLGNPWRPNYDQDSGVAPSRATDPDDLAQVGQFRPQEGVQSVSEIREVIIIGSGPAGYTAAIYAARAQLNPLVLEGSVTAGGALMNTTEVENFPGFPDAVMGPDLMDKLRAQAEKFGAELIADDAVAVELEGDIKTVRAGNGGVYQARAVILAMGSGYRELDIPGEKALSGHGVSWCATCDGFFFRNKTIAVVGGGDSAMEEATFLTKFAEKVYLIHRRNEFRASKIMQERALANPKIEVLFNAAPVEVLGNGQVEGVRLEDTTTGGTRDVELAGLFIAIGHDPRSELVKGVVELDDEGYVVTHGSTTYTSVPGVFACGDLVDHRYRQAITAAGSGCSAAIDAERWLAERE
jgi:thioredoxin reductase (NADPH)